jgi:hypothetical protein
MPNVRVLYIFFIVFTNSYVRHIVFINSYVRHKAFSIHMPNVRVSEYKFFFQFSYSKLCQNYQIWLSIVD